MGLQSQQRALECAIDGGLPHIVSVSPTVVNPIDGDFAASSAFAMAELSERDDVRSVLISAREDCSVLAAISRTRVSRCGAVRDDQIVDGGSPYRNRANGPHACARRRGGCKAM